MMKNKFYTQGTLIGGTWHGGKQGTLTGGTWHGGK